jgi:hypothetical protein
MKQSQRGLLASAVIIFVASCSDRSPPTSSAPNSAAGGVAGGSSGQGLGGTSGGAAGADAGASAGGAGGGDLATGGAVSAGGAGGAVTSGAGGQTPVAGAGGAAGQAGVDAFGIPTLRPSKMPGYEWTSLHWGTGDNRSLSDRDPSDPTGWSIRRGDTNLMEVDGAGVMSMGGAQPRFYIQPKTGETTPFFRDIEFTGYYRRTADDGASNSGFSVGVRAHLNGHGDVDHCLASTYYLIFRNSGTWIFDKELDHPDDSPRQGGSLFEEAGAIPVGKWIGMKYLAYNLPDDTSVKLEAYIDANSDGDGSQTEHWTKLGETIDAGDWNAPSGDCGFSENTVVTEGGGVVFIRNTAVTKVEYTKVSWREIGD